MALLEVIVCSTNCSEKVSFDYKLCLVPKFDKRVKTKIAVTSVSPRHWQPVWQFL